MTLISEISYRICGAIILLLVALVINLPISDETWNSAVYAPWALGFAGICGAALLLIPHSVLRDAEPAPLGTPRISYRGSRLGRRVMRRWVRR